MKTFKPFGGKYLVILIAAFLLSASVSTTSWAGSVTGSAMFDGTPPKMKEIKMESDPYCALQHPQAVLKETAVIGANGGLKYVFIYVKEGEELTAMIDNQEIQTPATPVVLDQKGCHYEPHVFGIMVGQPLEIKNSDQTLHNIHAMPTSGGAFNIGMPGKPEPWSLKKTFKAKEIMVPIKCDVHSWMSSYAGVLDHPFYSVTDGQGNFNIDGLPPGEYVIEAWHEKLGAQVENVTVTDEAPASLSFHFSAPQGAAEA